MNAVAGSVGALLAAGVLVWAFFTWREDRAVRKARAAIQARRIETADFAAWEAEYHGRSRTP